MGSGLDQAQQARELSKRRFEQTVDRAEARVRHELDWRARLRRDGARYAVIGTVAVAAVVGIVALRWRFGRHDSEEAYEPQITTLGDVAAELAAVRQELERIRKGKARDSAPLWQKAGLRAVAAAGSAAGTMAAERMMERFVPADSGADTAPAL